MDTQPNNPALSPWLRVFIGVVVVVLIIGSGLFFVPDVLVPAWPWKIAPFNARFLGSIYLAGLSGVSVLLFINRWAPARVALPMGIAFTAVVSLASILYSSNFNFVQTRTQLWFTFYIIPCFISAYFLWLYRHLPPADPNPPPSPWRPLLLAEGVVLGLYGLGAFFLPSVFTAFWPWKIDAFHAQIYSGLFITAAVGVLLLYRAAAPSEFLVLGLTHSVLGLFAPLGVLLVDSATHRVDWSSLGTWLWMAGCALVFLVGLAMLRQALVASRRVSAQVVGQPGSAG
ncbi:MAG: hypothetical protein ACJ78Q_08865 [Chloroflexia bacterium]